MAFSESAGSYASMIIQTAVRKGIRGTCFVPILYKYVTWFKHQNTVTHAGEAKCAVGQNWDRYFKLCHDAVDIITV